MEDQIINDLNTLVSNARVFPSPAAIRYIRKRAGYSEAGTTHPRRVSG